MKPGKVGPKLRPHSEGPPCTHSYGPQTQGGKPLDASVYPPVCEISMRTKRPGGLFRIGSRNSTMAQLAEGLYGMFDRPLIDQTGITGTIDYQVEFTFPMSFGPPAPTRRKPAGRCGNDVDGRVTRAAWVEAGADEGGTPSVGDRSRGAALGELKAVELNGERLVLGSPGHAAELCNSNGVRFRGRIPPARPENASRVGAPPVAGAWSIENGTKRRRTAS
jgi:hypothetical protein